MALSPATMASAPEAPRTGDMVMVGCKAPGGLWLNLDHYERVSAANDVVHRVIGPARVKLNGWSAPFGTAKALHGGYALTAVPRDFWDRWLAEHKGFSMLADNTILPPPDKGDAVGQAREYAKVEQMFRPARISDAPKAPNGKPILTMADDSPNKPQEQAA